MTTGTELRAFHGDEAIRQRYLARIEAHRLADELVRGQTGDGGKGCSVYCTFDVYDHSRGPEETGIPTNLYILNDFVFENLPNAESQDWPRRFHEAPKLGADLRLVWDRFIHWILTEEHPDRGEHCARMGALFARRIAGEEPSEEEWGRAVRDVWAAWAARDAGAVRAVRDVWAARDARDAGAVRDVWAVWAVRDVRDVWAAGGVWGAKAAASIKRMADKLIELMGAA